MNSLKLLLVMCGWIICLTGLNFLHAQPNILIVVADDVGIDPIASYGVGSDPANTPQLNALASNGIRFNNAWTKPACSPTRASILSGKYGNKTGVVSVGNILPLSEVTLFEQVENRVPAYSKGAFGKWHIGGNNVNHPNQQGADHYVGFIGGAVANYFSWPRVEDGSSSTSNEYVTTHITDEAIEWIDNQTGPWLAWVAHGAAHSPFHLPPDSLYTRTNTSTTRDQYLCMVESIDHEFGRLYNSLSPEEKENTLVIFIGDNGTPAQVIQGYPPGQTKATVYEGGVRVPMIAAGFGVDRINVTENAMIGAVDIYATIIELIGDDLPGGIYNSFSFLDLLSDPNAPTRPYNFTEYQGTQYAMRNEQYKLLQFANGSSAFYDLLADPLEANELSSEGLTPEQQAVFDELEAEIDNTVGPNTWSCNDGIQNGDETGIDCGGSCTSCGGDIEAPTVPGNLLASNTTQTSTQLSWNASTDNVAVTAYRVFIDGNLDGTTSNLNYTVSDLSASTTYNIQVTAIDAAANESGPASINVTTEEEDPITYCTAAGSNSSFEWIEMVAIGGFSNTSGNNGGYADFTAQTINVEAGQSYSLSLTPQFSSSTQYPERWRIWIDYNQDGDFTDAAEQVFDSNVASTQTVNGSLMVSGSASGITRMRIAMRWNAAPEPCGTFNYGEVEDYTIFINTGGGDTEPPSSPANLTASNTTQTSTGLSWNPSTDNIGVTAYRVYVDGNLDGSTVNLNYTVSDLSAGTTYDVVVTAIDAAGNESDPASINVTTLSSADTEPPSTPGNLTAFNTTSVSTQLSWTASTDNVGVVGYRIFVDGNLDGTSSSLNYTVIGLAATTVYNIQVTAIDAAGNESSPASINVTTGNGGPVTYCTAGGDNTSFEWIESVSLGGFSFTSGNNGGYADFTAQTINVVAGQTYSLSLTPQFSGTQYQERWRVWIDYNQDGDFTDAGEQVFDSNVASTQPVNGSLNVSGSASGSTRMRVAMRWNAAPESCGTFNYGEVEDYTLFISTGGGSDTEPPTTPTNLTASNTTQTSTLLSWNASSDNIGVTFYRVYVDGLIHGSTASLSYSLTSLSAATTYNIAVTAVDAANNESSPASTNVTTESGGSVNYCAASGNNASDEWIQTVSIGAFSNTSASNGGYGDFTGQTIPLSPGQAYNVSLSPGYAGTQYNEYWRIWIDFNADGDFTDAGEQVFDSNIPMAGTVNGNMTIPVDAEGATRMRIAMRWNAAPEPCGAFNYGEVEDYTVSFAATAQLAEQTELTTVRNRQVSEAKRPGKGNTNSTSTQIFEGLKLFPNPVKDQLKVQLPENVQLMKVLSVNGTNVLNIHTEGRAGWVDVSGLKAGMYYLIVHTNDQIYIDKFVKQ